MPARNVTHKNSQTIWLFNYPSLEEMDDCAEKVVFLSERDVNIIFQAVKDIDRWQSRVFQSGSNFNYLTVDDSQFTNFQNWVADMKNNLGAYQMCNDILQDIANSLRGITTMNGCCGSIEGVNGGSAGSGMEDAPPSDTDASEGAHSGPPPTGYDTWEEFDSLRCDWATYIYGQIRADVATMALVEIGTIGATGLAGILVPLLIEPVGWVILLSIATTMIAAALEAGFYGLIDTHLTTYNDSYICAMLTGDNVSDSVSNFASAVDSNVADDGSFNSLTGYWAKSILKGLGNVGSFNRMFEKQSLTVPSVDCPCDVVADCLDVTNGIDITTEAAEGYDGVLHVTTAGDGGGVGCSGTAYIRIECPCPVDVHISPNSAGSNTSGCLTFYVYDVMDSSVQFSNNVWTDQSIPSGGGLYVFTDSAETYDIFFTNT